MEPVTTYTLKSIQDGYIWEFKYTLNGDYMQFKVSSKLTDKQKRWLQINFPWRIEAIKIWQQKLKKNFEIKVNMPEITFELFWKMYPYNALSKKKIAKQRWDKLTEAQRTKIILNLPKYIKLKRRENQFFPYAEVFINGMWWDN